MLSISLSAAWQEHVRFPVGLPEDPAEVDGLLLRAFDKAREAWPSIPLVPQLFVIQLARRLPKEMSGQPLQAILKEFHLVDLYLACACVAGVPEARACFEQRCLADMPARLARAGIPPANHEDICQEVRVKLFVSVEGKPPYLVNYAGWGELRNWVFVIAARLGRQAFSSTKELSEDEFLDVLSDAVSARRHDRAELEHMRRDLKVVLKEVIQLEFSKLTTQQRQLIKYRFQKSRTTTQIGKLFQVNQSTISRRLEDTLTKLRKRTLRALEDRLRMSHRDLQSLLTLFDSQFPHISFSPLLGGLEASSSESSSQGSPS